MGYLSKLWERLRNRQRWPRSWWWPSDAGTPKDQEIDWQKQHDEVSITIRRVMLSYIAYCAFIVFTFSSKDADLVANAIKLPILDILVDFNKFLIIGPLVLLCLLFYMHIFINHLNYISKGEIREPLPYIFNLPGKVPRFLSSLFFYWLAPFVLYFLVFRIWRLRQVESIIFGIIATIVTAVLIFLRIKNWNEDITERRKISYKVHWTVFFCLILFAGLYPAFLLYSSMENEKKTTAEESIPTGIAQQFIKSSKKLALGGLNLAGEDLVKSDLATIDLRNANLMDTNMEGLDLSYKNFSGANLSRANLSETDLSGANFSATYLDSANFNGANLLATDFRKALNLNCDQLSRGNEWQFSYRDEKLSCDSEIPKGWIYIGEFNPDDRKWKTRYISFKKGDAPDSLKNRPFTIRDATGELNVRITMPDKYAEFGKIIAVLKPGQTVKVLSVYKWSTTNYYWAPINY